MKKIKKKKLSTTKEIKKVLQNTDNSQRHNAFNGENSVARTNPDSAKTEGYNKFDDDYSKAGTCDLDIPDNAKVKGYNEFDDDYSKAGTCDLDIPDNAKVKNYNEHDENYYEMLCQDILSSFSFAETSNSDVNIEKQKILKAQEQQPSPNLNNKIDAYKIAQMLKKECIIKAVANQENLYVYDDLQGSFAPYSKKTIPTLLFKMFTKPNVQSILNESITRSVFHFLLYDPDLQATMEDFNGVNEYLLNILNGVFDVRDFSLSEHNPNYMFTYTLQVNLPKKYHEPKKFLNMLGKFFSDENDQKRCAEMLAYTLSNNTSAKSICFFVGKANTGKSMLLRLIRRMMGSQYIASIPLSKLGQRFQLGSAMNCRANIVAETENFKLKDVKTLKSITGGDEVMVESKYETPYFTTLQMKLLLAGNHLPRLESNIARDDGLLARIQFLVFEHSLAESERIPFYDKILYEDEGDYIFYFLMSNLQKFYKRGCKFKQSVWSKVLSKEFCGQNQDTAEIFLAECCQQSTEGKLSVNTLYNLYQEFCENNKYTLMSRKHLEECVLSLPYRPVKDRGRIEGSDNPVSIYRGIKLAETF